MFGPNRKPKKVYKTPKDRTRIGDYLYKTIPQLVDVAHDSILAKHYSANGSSKLALLKNIP